MSNLLYPPVTLNSHRTMQPDRIVQYLQGSDRHITTGNIAFPVPVWSVKQAKIARCRLVIQTARPNNRPGQSALFQIIFRFGLGLQGLSEKLFDIIIQRFLLFAASH